MNHQRTRIAQLATELRQVAAAAGPMHSWWDFIGDLEAFLRGQPTLLKKTEAEWIAMAEQMLAEKKA